MKIYGDLLSILNAANCNSEKIVLTHVQIKMKVPFDRLKGYLSDLEGLQLIEDQTSYKLTAKGMQYLEEYRAVLDFMERMGIAYR
ncbi:MAG: winged helix-turn-helix domain-containing protein [Candidatus Bathyarchaeota archaeon]|nr:winged helix-turn-helix domain-containing protein [Candidatus Bathyarchaeota archaeon]